ncbi:MAG: acyltransferase [Bauldia sp.]
MPYRFQNIQALRAVAASLVLFAHACNFAAGAEPSLASAMWAMRHVGHMGVDIFFVISGFIMVVVARRGLENGPSPARVAIDFLRHRAVRIYPLFWITLAVLLILPAVPGVPHDWMAVLRDPTRLLLLVDPTEDVIAWSLTREIYFYGAVALIMLFGPRRFASAFVIAAILFVLLLVAKAVTGFGRDVSMLDRIALEFIIGAGIAALIASGVRAGWRTAIVAGVALLAASAALSPDAILLSGTRFLVWGIPAGPILYGLVAAEQTNTLLLPAWLRDFGDASYSLYMWHTPVLILLAALWPAIGLSGSLVGGVTALVAGNVLSILVARLSYTWIETPLMARGLAKRAGGESVPAVPAATARS